MKSLWDQFYKVEISEESKGSKAFRTHFQNMQVTHVPVIR